MSADTILHGHEKHVLAGLMNGHPHLSICADDFGSPVNAEIFQSIEAVKGRGVAPVLLAVQDDLRQRGKLKQVGGVAGLTDLVGLPTDDATIDYALGEVLEASRVRQSISIGKRLVNGSISPDEAKKELGQLRECSNGALPPIENVAELISRPIVLPDDVIVGLLHKGGKMVLGGSSKSFKTWQLIDLATAVSTGGDYLGFKTTQGRILYINLELQTGFFSQRCKTVAEEKAVSAVTLFDVWNLRGHAAELYKLLPAMLEAAGVEKYALIIVDPIYKVLGEREENVTHHITAIMNELERLAVHSGAAVVFGAHFSKGNQAAKESIDRISGSGAFARDPDTILIFTKHEEDDAYTVEATLRNHAPIEPFVVRWKFPLMERDEELDPSRLKQVGGRPRAATQAEILNLLDGEALKATEWQKRARDDFGIASSTFYEIKAELAKLGRVRSVAGKFIKS